MSARGVHRRTFLQHSAAALATLAAAGTTSAKAAKAGYGPLHPANDETTGLPLLQLPRGFRYLSFGWTGSQLHDGRQTPGVHDGMAVIKAEGSRVTLVRNHEVDGAGELMGDPRRSYDVRGSAGCTNLVFDTSAGKLVNSWVSLSGTVRNCAGGPTPWGTWLSCEETTDGIGDGASLDGKGGYGKTHGWIFEVPADGASQAVPLKAMGRFRHEAIAVDPQTGIVYETEDEKKEAGFYRFIPRVPGKLSAGGKLQMLKVDGHPDLRPGGRQRGPELACSWVDIPHPEDDPSEPGKAPGCFGQGAAQGGTAFARLEGCWYGEGKIYFTASSSGLANCGQVWEYDPERSRLRLVFESPDAATLDCPDNGTISPRGGILLCENGGPHPQRLHGLTTSGVLFPFAANNVLLEKPVHGFEGDFTAFEWAGVCFSPDGQWMFANIQTPGITFAITGPWEQGVL